MNGRILVTGSTRGLGLAAHDVLVSVGAEVVGLARHGEIAVDLATGEGLTAAMDGVSAVVHAATNPVDAERVDVSGTERLLAAARDVGVCHFLYVSIVGVNVIGVDAARAYPYFAIKEQVEQAVRRTGIPWTILRATQFHDILPHRFFPAMVRNNVIRIGRDWLIQPVATIEVAQHVAALIR